MLIANIRVKVNGKEEQFMESVQNFNALSQMLQQYGFKKEDTFIHQKYNDKGVKLPEWERKFVGKDQEYYVYCCPTVGLFGNRYGR